MGGLSPSTPVSFYRRPRVLVLASVLLLHGLVLLGLQSGLLQRAVLPERELLVPVTVVPPALPPAKPPPPPAAPTPKTPTPRKAVPQPAPAAPAPAPQLPAAAPAPLAVAESAPSANAPQGVLKAAPAPASNGVAAAPAPPRLELPSSDAAYLNNPKPAYPRLSLQRNEQGTVRLAVLVGVDGRAKEVQLKVSSGFERLDRAALDAVVGWTFVPGKRNGVAEEMWYELPMPFRLTQ